MHYYYYYSLLPCMVLPVSVSIVVDDCPIATKQKKKKNLIYVQNFVVMQVYNYMYYV